MKCAVCDSVFDDGVQCGVCKKYLDFGCANISEAGYKKLGADRRAAWKCPQCKQSRLSPAPSNDSSILENILRELRDVKNQLAKLSTLVDEVKCIKQELSGLKESCEFNGDQLDKQAVRISNLEQKIPDMQKVESSIEATTTDINALKKGLALRDQWTRLNNIEVKGVPVKTNENLYSIVESLTKVVGYSFPKSQINYIARVPIQNSKEKYIVINFVNRYIKEEFIAAARAMKHITSADIGFAGNSQRTTKLNHKFLNSSSLGNLKRQMGMRFEDRQPPTQHFSHHDNGN
ncbi:unnamed protein product [Diatraea saccharalis]|uniref:Zinc finger DNA binding protein n=1 Tax=Diatraea saccharalis TaxID=40085 RepID=A0A9N9N2J7_9NEOP|nr:unnamed protein product [Diatraea saccharalis]